MVDILAWLVPLVLGVHMVWSREKFAAEALEAQRRLFSGRAAGGSAKSASWLPAIVGVFFIVIALLKLLESGR